MLLVSFVGVLVGSNDGIVQTPHRSVHLTPALLRLSGGIYEVVGVGMAGSRFASH